MSFGDISVGNLVIKKTKCANILGIFLNDRLSFSDHINYTKNRLLKYATRIKSLSSLKFGFSPKQMRLIYTQLFQSIGSYGCLAWYGALDKKCTRLNIDKIQRYFSSLRNFRSSCIEYLIRLNGFLYLSDYITIQAICRSLHNVPPNKFRDIHNSLANY